ncbi:hypothetical protein A4G18_07465 [Pasteurellaceae bacterium Pebbles2]|nr:hypothetical protein [Pasteurellaceae bacterium Pebbles2]
MELLLLVIGLPLVIGVGLAVAMSGFTVIGAVLIGIFTLMFRFWYISFIVTLAIIFPLIFLNNWGMPILIGLGVFTLIFYLTPLTEEQKTEIAQLKTSLKS